MIVSINGKPGAGKSTVAKRLATVLGYERIYIGGIRREVARSKGMTLQEFNVWSEEHPEGDKEFDDYLRRLGQEKDNLIVESRTAFHFIPHSLKIFLEVTLEEGARRIWGALQKGDSKSRNEASELTDYQAVLTSVQERLRSDQVRYQKYYNLDIFKPEHYDLFLDVTDLDPEQEFEAVYSFVKGRMSG